MTSGKKRPQRRADAQRNRPRILEAARTRFAVEGLHAQVDDIARDAAVAVGTIYHHFGTKEGLLEAVVLDRFRETAEYIHTLLMDGDAWSGIERVLRYLAERQLTDRAFKEVVAAHQELRERVSLVMHEMTPLLQQLVDRAQAAKQLRADVMAEDLLLLVAILPGSEIDPAKRTRYLEIIIDGLRIRGNSSIGDRTQ
ncbi:TetR family transcriptional regulator [Dictyobacter alpinus]|uniref:TetR family transcriptional regulator n=1 Tax=Dictyobacter alpinus TaxID=2014873 RepID=A0A402BEC0_9CHLR|nr:TetR/AcrR family transcriptional regulator [Dictyobacter alpinus]GCE29656.1 TetR family transcriptional regulator [Dictyobacter alpinus]